MVKRLILILGLFLVFSQHSAFAAGAATEPKNVPDASFQTRCMLATKIGFPECADSPAECSSKWLGSNNSDKFDYKFKTPFNCIFLQEPIGGRTGYDLYKVVVHDDVLSKGEQSYELWFGEVLTKNEYGPFQAILVYEKGKETQGPFSLLYNYLGLIYNFMSGIIVAVVILIVIVGGIRISAAGGNADSDKGGKDMILKALIGMALWFTASVILYTINPTFFAF